MWEADVCVPSLFWLQGHLPTFQWDLAKCDEGVFLGE
jgi:hypothetical protein